MMALAETNWVSNTIAAFALGVSGLALYLQRKDSRPRLGISGRSERVAPMLHEETTGRVSSGPEEWAQVFKIRNVGTWPVRVVSARMRWLWGRPKSVGLSWNRTPLLEPFRSCEATLLSSKADIEPLTGVKRALPFYRVDFIDEAGHAWSAGFRRVRF